jgi:CheY-like chemotaxis protein
MSSSGPHAYRILVCDDEPAVLRALSVALESHGYAITAADSGEQAVARAASEPPDLMLLDLGLPGIDGRETIRRIRAFLPDTPIIVLSAWAEDETKVEALDLGADPRDRSPGRRSRCGGAADAHAVRPARGVRAPSRPRPHASHARVRGLGSPGRD